MPVVAGPGPGPSQGLPDLSAMGQAGGGGGAGPYSRWRIGGAPRPMRVLKPGTPAWKLLLAGAGVLAAVLWLRSGR